MLKRVQTSFPRTEPIPAVSIDGFLWKHGAGLASPQWEMGCFSESPVCVCVYVGPRVLLLGEKETMWIEVYPSMSKSPRITGERENVHSSMKSSLTSGLHCSVGG